MPTQHHAYIRYESSFAFLEIVRIEKQKESRNMSFYSFVCMLCIDVFMPLQCSPFEIQQEP
jgi:hypothetical protein